MSAGVLVKVVWIAACVATIGWSMALQYRQAKRVCQTGDHEHEEKYLVVPALLLLATGIVARNLIENGMVSYTHGADWILGASLVAMVFFSAGAHISGKIAFRPEVIALRTEEE